MITFKDICNRYGVTVKEGRKIAKSKKGFKVELVIPDTPDHIKRRAFIDMLELYQKIKETK